LDAREDPEVQDAAFDLLAAFRLPCIFVDFDSTLAFFPKGKEGLFKIFTKRDASLDDPIVEGLYDKTKRQHGFSIDAMISVVEESLQRRFSDAEREQIRKEFDAWSDDALKLYDDCDQLDDWRNEGRLVAILTAGDDCLQTRKIRSTGADALVDGVKIVKTAKKKVTFLKEFRKKYEGQVVLIEDEPATLDKVKEELNLGDVVTYRLLRDESPYVKNSSDFEHETVGNLKGVAASLDQRLMNR
jgi:hypothetical protein